MPALDVVETQQQGNQRGFSRTGMPHDGDGLSRIHAERHIAQDPVFLGGLGDIAIAEPHVAEFNFAPRMVERNGVGIRFDQHRLIEQLEDALGGGHGGLQDVEFLAQVLNRPEKTLREHGESREDAKTEGAVENAVSARPKNQSDGGEAEEFDGRIKKSVGEDGIAPGEHIVTIALLKFIHGLAFAVEELYDAHPGNVFLKEGIDARNGRADAAIGISHVLAEDHRDDQDAGENSESIERQPAVNLEKNTSHDHEQEEIVDHGDDAGSEKIVEGIDVRGHARDQPTDRISVEVAHRQPLHVAEDLAAHVVHGLLADALHDAKLCVLGEEIEDQDAQENHTKPADTRPCRCFGDDVIQRRSKVTVDSLSENERRGKLERSDDGHQDERKHHAPFVGLHVLQKPPHQARVVRFAEGLFFVQVAHARSSSSSSNCFWYKSA